MELFRKRRSDQEYVEMIRGRVARERAIGVFFLCMVVVFGVLLYLLLRMQNTIVSDFSNELAQSKDDHFPNIVGFILGITFGITFGVILSNMLGALSDALKNFKEGNRTEKLMLKFYDELNKNKT